MSQPEVRVGIIGAGGMGLGMAWRLAARGAAATGPANGAAALAPGIAGAVLAPQDHQVDNRRLVTALRVAASGAGAVICEHQGVARIMIERGRVGGVALDDGSEISADVVVLAAGAWSRGI